MQWYNEMSMNGMEACVVHFALVPPFGIYPFSKWAVSSVNGHAAKKVNTDLIKSNIELPFINECNVERVPRFLLIIAGHQ